MKPLREEVRKRKTKQFGICQYCKIPISLSNKFYDIYTCSNCKRG